MTPELHGFLMFCIILSVAGSAFLAAKGDDCFLVPLCVALGLIWAIR